MNRTYKFYEGGKYMKKANKLLSVVLALLMIVSLIPMSGITASAESYDFKYIADVEYGRPNLHEPKNLELVIDQLLSSIYFKSSASEMPV